MANKKTSKLIRIASMIMTIVIIISMGIIPVSAVGDPNMGGENNGGGGTGSGSSGNKWPSGYPDGVRVSIYKGNSKVGKTVDFTNSKTIDGIAMKNVYHFGKYSKKDYLNGRSLTPNSAKGSYTYVNPTGSRKLPKIIKDGNINTIRNFFSEKTVVELIAKETGVNYDTMVNDASYQMVIEPIIYVVYGGYAYAMTATEMALFNTLLGGALRSNSDLQRVLFVDLPRSLYLQKSTLGIGAWNGKEGLSGDYVDNSVIRAKMGIGAINFKNDTNLGSKVETQVVAMANSPNWNEGDKAKIGVVFMNNGSSTRVFPITIWVGDGINKGKAEAYKIETSIRIGAGQTYIYHIPTTVTMQPWITTVTARINYSNRSKETNPNNNHQTFALNVKKKATVETLVEIPDIRVYRDGKWQNLKDLPTSQRILNEGERINPSVVFTNNSTSQTKFPMDVWVGDGLGTAPLTEYLLWRGGIVCNPPVPSSTAGNVVQPSSYTLPTNIKRTVGVATWGYPVKATDTDITARINYPNRAQETNSSNNQAIYKIQVRPKNQTVETSVESVKAYNQHGKEVTQFVSGQTYTIKATYKNDSSDQTSFPVRLAFGATVPPGSGTAVSGSGTKTIAKGGGKYVLTTTYKATGTSTLHWQASINWDNRMIETNTSNNFTAGTFKTVASASVVETSTRIMLFQVKRGVPGGGMAWIDYKQLKEGGAAPYQPLTEGEEVRVTVQFFNRSTSRTNFFANIYIGDGLHNLDPSAGPIVNGPQKEFKLWQNGKQLTKLDEDAPSSWNIPILASGVLPQTITTTHQYKVKLTDCAITSRINNTNKLEEENPNDNEDIYRFTVRPNSKIETSITNISVTDLDDVPVARLLEGDTYKVKAFFKNDSEKLTSFPITISTASGELVSTSKTISLGGTAQHEVTFTVPENSNNTITFYSDINYANRAQETNPNNNRMSITYEVIGNDLSAEFIEPNSAYREGVEVISSFYVYNHGITNIVPTHNLDIELSAYFYDDDNQKIELQTELLQDHIVPAIGNNLAYFKWTVPEKKAAKDGKVYIECIVDPEEQFKDPDRDNNHVVVERPIKTVKISQTPMTKYERGPEPTWSLKGSSFRPRMNEFTSLRKTEFIWEEWVWENNWFAKNEYSVAIDNKAKAELEPDTHSPSREEQQNGKWMMRSGYGHYVRYVPDYVVNAPNNAWTEMQNATVHFPDLEYSAKFGEYATLEKDEDIWQLPPHPQSKYDEKLHFTKLWFPDGDYTVLTYAYDIWTPAGMVNNFVRSKEMLIDGSMYDDWGVIRK